MEKQLDDKKQENEIVKKELSQLKDESIHIKKMFSKYVYPEVAKELLREKNFPVKGQCKVTDAAITDLIAPKQPEAYNGSQGDETASGIESRGSKLISIMRKQVGE